MNAFPPPPPSRPYLSTLSHMVSLTRTGGKPARPLQMSAPVCFKRTRVGLPELAGLHVTRFTHPALNSVWCRVLQDEVHLDRPYVRGGRLRCVWEGVVDSAAQHPPLQQQNSGTECFSLNRRSYSALAPFHACLVHDSVPHLKLGFCRTPVLWKPTLSRSCVRRIDFSPHFPVKYVD